MCTRSDWTNRTWHTHVAQLHKVLSPQIMVIAQQKRLRKFSSSELLGQVLNEAVLPWEVSFVSSYRQYLFDSVQMVVHEYWSN